MALRTVEQYRDSLRDGRAVYFRGERVRDVNNHPVIGLAVEHASIDYRMAEDPHFRGLALVNDGAGEYSRYFQIPRNAGDLLARKDLIAAATREGATLVVLIKEIGTDALFALEVVGARMAAAGIAKYQERIRAFHRYCRDNDLAVAVAQTDAKGDRALGPAAQNHPDYYVRIVGARSQGSHVGIDQRQRDYRAADSRDESRRSRLCRRVRCTGQRAGTQDDRESAWQLA